MPLVGVIPVAGHTTQQIEGRLREAYGTQYLRNPQITVEVKEFHHQRVAVTGAIMKPGYYDIIGPRTLHGSAFYGRWGWEINRVRKPVTSSHVIQHQDAAVARQHDG